MLDDINEYLSINLKDYDNIGINLEINKFLLLVALALCVTFFVVNYKRSLISEAVKQLLRHGALSEDSAKTLGELGLSDSRGIKRELLGDTQLRRMVMVVEEEKKLAPDGKLPSHEELVAMERVKEGAPSINFNTARIYVAPGSLERAKFIYNNYNTSLVKTILLCVFCIAISVCLMLLSPGLLSLINSSLG